MASKKTGTSHYDFHRTFRAVYERALAAYDKGVRSARRLLSPAQVRFLESIGGRAQDLFDYAEDAAKYGEPDFETALLIESVRRDYFLAVQRGRHSRRVLDAARLPDKTASVRGIEWLPRLIPKARAKLRGELPESLMYSCGGDRGFFKTHDIHPAEFLRAVWFFGDDDRKLVAWVKRRSTAAARA